MTDYNCTCDRETGYKKRIADLEEAMPDPDLLGEIANYVHVYVPARKRRNLVDDLRCMSKRIRDAIK